MGDDFIFDEENKASGIFKKILVFAGIGIGLLAIFLFLIMQSFSGKATTCEKVSENTGISVSRCEEDEKFSQIIFVLGDTANTPKPQIDDEYIEIITTMYDLNGKNGLSYLSVSKPDDVPRPFEIKKQRTDKIKKKISEQIESSRATVDGADYLEAIRNAAGYAKDKENTLIYVIGSGLSDSGLLNFAEDKLLTDYDIDEIQNYIASKVKDREELSGLTIVWDGLGETVSPQSPLRQETKNTLEDIYRVVFKEFGVSNDGFIKTNHPKKEYLMNDVATTVKTTEVEIEICKINNFSADNSDLAFYPGKAKFKDRAAAKDAIEQLAKDCSDAYYVIKPFMSRGWCDGKKDDNLLRDRALATKSLLNSVGIDDSNIEIQDGGIGDANECPGGPGHYPVDENEASKNRIIRISVLRK